MAVSVLFKAVQRGCGLEGSFSSHLYCPPPSPPHPPPSRRRPSLAVLDEPVAAVAPGAAAELYSALHAAGVTCVSVGQDVPHLRAAHRVLLRLGGEGGGLGGWELERCGGEGPA